MAPTDGDPLATIDRDAGIAVRLSDGSTLWLFGDTAARDDAGQLTYFVIGTASWAPAGQPTVTRDATDPLTGEPARFAAPTPEFPTCPKPDQVQGMWPSAAVVQPVGNRDRVLVWLENVCLGQSQRLDDAGMSIAEWWYDPADPPDRTPIVATMLNQRLFPSRSYGSAVLPGRELATTDAAGGRDRELFVYRCGTTTVGGSPDAYGPCHVARTTIADAADSSAYREWDGTGFEAPVGDGTPLTLPEGRTAVHPPAGFSVVDDPAVGGLVMIYSPWPGPSAYVDVRIAQQPQGPWSRPVTITLPGCDDQIGERVNRCYAGNAQPWLSAPGQLGIGYYDSQVATIPLRGGFHVAAVPIEVG